MRSFSGGTPALSQASTEWGYGVAVVAGLDGEGGDEACGLAPWAVEVVGHEAYAVDDAGYGGEVGALVHVGAGTYGYGEEEVGAESGHAGAQLGEQGEVVGGVGLVGILPVDVEAVDEPGDGDAGGEVAFEEGVDAGADEGFTVFG